VAKPTIGPFCKYHPTTRMQPATGPDGRDDGVFSATSVVDKRFNLGQGYLFKIYECPECTYLELHDFVPQ